jgi:iron complex transport system substrate-binding protein
MRVFAFNLLVLLAASTLVIDSAVAYDWVLGIFGNANMDDTIDGKDVTYVDGIIKGTNRATNLSDANYDGKIDVQDMDQIKKIISGEEKELIIVDFSNRTVRVKKPVESVITLLPQYADAVRTLGAKNKIVGVDKSTAAHKIDLPGISELPSTGSFSAPDVEKILDLKPDLVIDYHTYAAKLDDELTDNIAVVGCSLHKPEKIREEITKLGYILDRKQDAERYLAFHDKYIGLIEKRTGGVSDEAKPKVYLEWDTGTNTPYRTYGGESYDNKKLVMAGGKNIFADILGGESATVDPEAVVARNPDILILKQYASLGNLGYEKDDEALAKSVIDTIISRPELANVDAVMNGRVYIISGDITTGLSYPVCVAYYAKWFHPELFKDLDPRTVLQEYIDDFSGIDYNVTEHGVFGYPTS